jgi:hypothetical protein
MLQHGITRDGPSGPSFCWLSRPESGQCRAGISARYLPRRSFGCGGEAAFSRLYPGDTTHELQNTANGTDVECKLLRRGFVSLRNVRLSVVPNKHSSSQFILWRCGTQRVRLSSSGSSHFLRGTSMGFDEGQKIKVWLFVSWFFSLSFNCFAGGSWGSWYSKLGLFLFEVRMVHPNLLLRVQIKASFCFGF